MIPSNVPGDLATIPGVHAALFMPSHRPGKEHSASFAHALKAVLSVCCIAVVSQGSRITYSMGRHGSDCHYFFSLSRAFPSRNVSRAELVIRSGGAQRVLRPWPVVRIRACLADMCAVWACKESPRRVPCAKYML